ncbi:hypothetical protein ACTFIY_011924 [Dictyostelium cf. discoideum]
MYNIENNSILIDNETFSYKKTIRDNSLYRSITIGIIIFLLNNLVKNFSNSEIVLGLSPKFKILLFIISLISSLFVTILISKTCKKISLIIPSIFLYFLFLTNCYIQFHQDNGNANITGELNQNNDSGSTISGSGSGSNSDGSDNGQFKNDINKQILVTVISIVSIIMSPFFIQYFWVSTMEFIIKFSNQSNIGLHFGIILGLPDFLDSLFSFLVKHFTLNNYYEFGLIFIIPIIILILLLGKTSITCNKFDKISFDSNSFFDGNQIQYQQYQHQHHHYQHQQQQQQQHQQQQGNIQIQNNEIPLPTSIKVKSNSMFSTIKLMKKIEFIHMVPIILLYGFIGNWLNYELFDEIILGYKANTQFIIISHLISSCLCFTVFGYFSDKIKRNLILISVLLIGIIGSVINVLVIYYEIELFEKNTSLYFSSLLFIQIIYYLIGIQIYSHISHLFEDKFNSLYSSSSSSSSSSSPAAAAEISSAIIFSSNYSFLSSELFSYYSPLSISAAIKFTQIFGCSILYFVYNWSTFFIRFIVFIVLLVIGTLCFIHSIKQFSKKSKQFKQFLILNSNDDEEYNGF